MSLRVEVVRYSFTRSAINAYVRARTNQGDIVFADTVNLASARSRNEFALALRASVDATDPALDTIERTLLDWLALAETELAGQRIRSVPASAHEEERLVEGYERSDGRFEAVVVRDSIAGPVSARIPLSNFLAEIVLDLEIDDGVERRRYFELRGSLGDQQLPIIRVPADQFGRMGWIADRWGVRPRVLPGRNRRALLRDAIQAFSAGAPHRILYCHTGWRWIDGRLAFLHAGGALGADGPIEGVEAELDGRLGLYELAAPPAGGLLSHAVRRSWQLWGVAAAPVAATVLGAVYGAPLSEWLRPDFAVWAIGPSGVLKTTYTALALAHFGAFDHRQVPAGWESTENALERQAFLAKDVPLLIDDFRPPADRRELQELQRKAARIVRAVGNRLARARLSPGARMGPTYWPRGIILVTAEERPAGESVVARSWQVEFTSETVDRRALTEAQASAHDLRLAGAAYVRWLAAAVERNPTWAQELDGSTPEPPGGIGGHLRHAQTFRYLLTAWRAFGRFACEVGAATPEEVNARLDAVGAALRAVAGRQAEAARDLRPELVFLDVLGDLVATGKAHLATLGGQAPPEAAGWGWTSGADGARPLGRKLGWLDDQSLYLIPSAAHGTVTRAVVEQGGSFAVSDRALREALRHAGMLRPGNKENGRRHNVKAEGAARNVLRLDRGAVEALWAGAR